MNRIVLLGAAWFLCFPFLADATEAPVVGIPERDASMTSAFAKARSTLDEFFAVWQARPAGTSAFAVKVEVREGTRAEVFWIAPFRTIPTGFEGRISNEPQVVRFVRKGQEISFRRAEILDWTYMRDGKMVGNFTGCAALRHMPKNESDHYIKTTGISCPAR